MSAGEFRLRVRYRKAGRLRWLSHLEVVHALERTIRRANVPFAVTQGFSPHLKAAFGPALPVGTAGENEYVDVWLREYTDAARAAADLARVSPEDLAPTTARYVAGSEPSLTAALTIGVYRVELQGREPEQERVRAALGEVLGAGELTVVNRGKKKVYDLVRSVPKDVRVEDLQDGMSLEMAIRMGPEGSLRPEALVRAAFEHTDTPVPVLHTTRLDTFVESDEGVWSRPL